MAQHGIPRARPTGRSGTERLLAGMTPDDRRYWRRHLAAWNAPLRRVLAGIDREIAVLTAEARSGELRPPGGTRVRANATTTPPLPPGEFPFVKC